MALAVTSVAAGGLAVVEVTTAGLPVTEAVQGLAVTKVTGGKPGLGVVFVNADGGPVTPPITPATFNGTPSGLVTVTNGGRTVAHNNSSSQEGVCSRSGYSSGKYYFELTLQGSVSSAEGIGVAPFTSGAWADPGGNAIAGFGLNLGTAGSTIIYSNNVSSGKNLGTAAVGNVFGFALDLTAKLGWVSKNGGNWNNDAAANPATGVGGVTIPAGTLAPYVRFAAGGATDAVTGNFGASAFAGAVPSGFTSGWPA